ncbi:MAG: hypothetical protein IPP49_09510 [Saprospiraceae bacterium]|nr:hypothetical protein [Saprospiraceae bacterium]
MVISAFIALPRSGGRSFARGIIAKSLHSNLHYKEIDKISDTFNAETSKTQNNPERISSDVFIQRITKTKLSLIAVDGSTPHLTMGIAIIFFRILIFHC